MSENENMEKDFKDTETAGNKIDKLDCDSLTDVAGGVEDGEIAKISEKLKKAPVVLAYGHPGMIGLKYGFPSGRPNFVMKKKLELEAKLKDPNLSLEERKRIEGLLKMYKSGGLSGENKQ